MQTPYKNNVGGKKLLKLFGKTKGATYVIEQLPSSLKPESLSREAGASFEHLTRPYVRVREAETQNCRTQKTHKSGVCFPGYKLDAFNSEKSHKREEKCLILFSPFLHYNYTP